MKWGARVLRVRSVPREEVWASAGVQGVTPCVSIPTQTRGERRFGVGGEHRIELGLADPPPSAPLLYVAGPAFIYSAGHENARGAAPAACNGPRTPRAGNAGTGPPSRKVRDSILSRLRGSRPTPAESLNLSPPLSPPQSRARAPALGKHAACGGQGLAGAMSDR